MRIWLFLGEERGSPARARPPAERRPIARGPQTIPAATFFPQERRDLVAHDAVEDPTGLLGVDPVLVDRVRVLEGAVDLGFGDGREDHAALACPGSIPSSSARCHAIASLAVKVGCEPDVAAAGQLSLAALEVGDLFFFAGEDLVGGLELLLEVHARDRALDTLGVPARQVADVADAGQDHVPGPQVLIDRLGLGRRLDDDELLAANRRRDSAAVGAARCAHRALRRSRQWFGSCLGRPVRPTRIRKPPLWGMCPLARFN